MRFFSFLFSLTMIQLLVAENIGFVGTVDSATASVLKINADTLDVLQVYENSTNTYFAGMAVTPDGKRLFVTAGSGEICILVLDVETLALIGKITSPEFVSPTFIAITPDGRRAYVTDFNANKVFVVDNSLLAVIDVIDSSLSGPFGIVISPNGRYVYVGSGSDSESNILRVDTKNDNSQTLIPTGNKSTYLAQTPDGRYLYTTNNISNSVTKIDTQTLDTQDILDSSQVTSPYSIAITKDGRYAYIGQYNDNFPYHSFVWIVDLQTNVIVDQPLLDKQVYYLAASSDGKKVYASLTLDAKVNAIDTQTRQVLPNSINIGFPWPVAFVPLRPFNANQALLEAMRHSTVKAQD